MLEVRFNSSFASVSLDAGAFAMPGAISAFGLVPFNVQDIAGKVYVTCAPSGLAVQRAATAGMGAYCHLQHSPEISQEVSSVIGRRETF